MNFEFKGITALVTGASAGIGECFARQLAEQGANLILVARSEDKLRSLAAELKLTYSIEAHVFAADLSFHEAPRRLFDNVQQAGIHVDLLINNAGFGRYGFFEETTAEADDAMLDVNISSLVALTHLFLPGMLRRKKGGILNLASTAAFQPIPFLALYSATKSFVVSFSEALWGEYRGRGIRVLCLCPGNTETGFHRVAGSERKRVIYVAKAEAVARFGLRVFRKSNRPTAIYGFFNWLLTQTPRLFPRRCVAFVTGFLFRPSSSFSKQREPQQVV